MFLCCSCHVARPSLFIFPSYAAIRFSAAHGNFARCSSFIFLSFVVIYFSAPQGILEILPHSYFPPLLRYVSPLLMVLYTSPLIRISNLVPHSYFPHLLWYISLLFTAFCRSFLINMFLLCCNMFLCFSCYFARSSSIIFLSYALIYFSAGHGTLDILAHWDFLPCPWFVSMLLMKLCTFFFFHISLLCCSWYFARTSTFIFLSLAVISFSAAHGTLPVLPHSYCAPLLWYIFLLLMVFYTFFLSHIFCIGCD